MATKGTNLISARLCYFLFLLFFFIGPSKAITDTILQGQQLRNWEQLFSDNGYFRLGFFSTGYKKNRYLGIFYNRPAPSYSYSTAEDGRGEKAIWVANRNNPITDISGLLLMIDEYGSMKISYNGSKALVLSSVEGVVNASATLLDTGNFILRELNLDGSTKRVLWQSFDYPTDTLLPGMKLGINLKTGHTWSLTSWISDDNPAPGSFRLGGDPNGTNQLIIWWQEEIYWTSGSWINGKFGLVPLLSHDYHHRFSYISNQNEKYFTFSMSKEYTFPRYTIESSGIVSESEGSSIFGECYSPYGSDGGCVKVKWPECRDNNTNIYEQRGFIYGDGFKFDESHNMSSFDCQAKCLINCSCAAYASINEDGTGCELWSKEMEIIKAYRDRAARRIHVLYEIYDKVAKEEHLKKDRWTIWLIIAAAGVPVILMLCSLFQFIRRKHRIIKNMKRGLWALASAVKKWGVGVGLAFKYYLANIKRSHDTLISMEKLNKYGKKSPELRFFSFKSIASASDNFATRNELGKGGFGPVYKGKLQNGQEIAIKRLSRNSGQGLAEFKNELTLIARLQHTNLVRLVGCCIQRKEMMLIYEYMPNKSLDFFLFDPMRRNLLDWKKRLDIIQGIAQGLLYLHKYSRLRMIHRDLKAGNILLDDEMNPKISDFGMARIFEQNESKANTNRIVGTYGYMSPEYAMEGICSLKSDVFSFGVLLLEIISGTKNNSYYQPEQPLNLTGHTWELWKEDRCLELMDPTLENSYNNNEVLRCIHVGLLCVQDNPIDRPTMSDVAAMISYETIPLSVPKQPAFFIHKSLPGAEIVEHNLEIGSLNMASITEMGAR